MVSTAQPHINTTKTYIQYLPLGWLFTKSYQDAKESSGKLNSKTSSYKRVYRKSFSVHFNFLVLLLVIIIKFIFDMFEKIPPVPPELENNNAYIHFIELYKKCVTYDPTNRPSMKEVLHFLSEL
jgi:hypothetical protein